MLPSNLLIQRTRGEEVVPKRLELSPQTTATAQELIGIFQEHVGKRRGDLDEALQLLEGEETDYRMKRGLAHLLSSDQATFETVSPLEPALLRERVFALSAKHPPGDREVLTEVAHTLSEELDREVGEGEVLTGLYADLLENQHMIRFDAPTPDALIHRYNLAQAQGILYRASQVVITAYRNVPGQYKLLFRYLKLFGLMAYIEGDPDNGFTITIDGPASILGTTTRYGVSIAKFLPALLHVTRWSMTATLTPRTTDLDRPTRFSPEADCNLVSHYKKGKVYDSILEEALSKRWETLQSEWRLEREVDLVPLPGSVMIPDFSLIHADGRSFLLEIVGYWRPEYLKKKFAQVQKSGREDIILCVSERLNLEAAGVKIEQVPAKVVWFKGKVEPKDVLAVIE